MAAYQDDKLVKKAFAKVSYTKEQLDELRACMDPETGPSYFIENFMYVQHPTKGKQKLILYDFQKGLLENYMKYRKSVNICGRQLGKCLIHTTLLQVRNKVSGEIMEITFGDFEKLLKNQ